MALFHPKILHTNLYTTQAALIAYEVNAFGRREILGASVSLSEAEVHWRQFLQSLSKRGLTGIELFISDSYIRLTGALRAIFPSIPWQRCQFHIMQNAMRYASKKSMIDPIVEAGLRMEEQQAV